MLVYLFCTFAIAVGLGGAVALARRSLFWSAGLLIGALGASAYAGAMAGSAFGFKVYYALAASMLPGWIGAGSIDAIFSRRVARWPAAFVLLLSVAQLILTLPAEVNPQALARLGGGNGEGILSLGSWVVPTVLFNTFGLGFAAVSAFYGWWKAFRVPASRHAALALGLSLVVLGLLVRSAGVYRVMDQLGAGSAFLLADAIAFALIWAGALLSLKLPGPLERALIGSGRPRDIAGQEGPFERGSQPPRGTNTRPA